MTTRELVLTEQVGSTRILTLNRPEARNALSQALNHALLCELADAEGDVDTAVILLAGSGDAFCAGLDLKELAVNGFDGTDEEEHCIGAVASTATPVIGLVDGPAVTGGFELALACDFLIASPAARFADTHSRVGIVPGDGLTARLAEAIGVRRARQLSATGQYIDAVTALAWGLVNEIVDAERLRERGLAVAEAFIAADAGTLHEVWKLYDAGTADRVVGAIARETEVLRTWVADASKLALTTSAVLEHGRAQDAAQQ